MGWVMRFKGERFLLLWACVLIGFAQMGCGGDDVETAFTTTTTGGSGGTGGSGATGGSGGSGAMGGSGGNGATGGGGTGGGAACGVEIIAPADGAELSEEDDADQDCDNGFEISVRAAVDAAEGATAELSVNGASAPGDVEVAGPSVTFDTVSLNANASNDITVTVGECSDTITVDTTCADVPTCEIVSPTGEFVNGVPSSEGGDRTSSPDSPYQIEVRVSSNIADGEVVSLTVDGDADAAAAFVSNGTAVFPGVELTPDGDHTLRATCRSEAGRRGQSAEVEVTVDSEFPDLEIVGLEDGQHFSPDDDVDPDTPELEFDVCGLTESADSLSTGTDNFCVAVGTQSPDCAPATQDGAEGESGGCVRLTCPGSAPFDVTVSVADEAGNITQKIVSGVTCASTSPSVQLVKPADGAAILAATMPEPHDEGSATGAQFTVVACTNSTQGSAQLFAGREGETLEAVATADVEPATDEDACPSGLMNVVRFEGATLPESSEASDGKLISRTQLRVEVVDQSTEVGTSGDVNVWVDSIAPVVTVTEPSNLCGRLFQSAGSVDVQLRFSVGSNEPLEVTITPNGGPGVTETFANSGVLGLTQYKTVTFALGTTEVAATITEPSGNMGSLVSPCTVTVGNPPVVTWVTPTLATKFNASTDADPNTDGWQGDLQVDVSNIGSGGEVQFSVNGEDLGAPVAIQPDGSATLTDATIPEGASVTLTATTNDLGDGVGTASLSPLVVDVTVPDAVTDLTPSVRNRRQTTFRLEWTIPADGAGSPSTYEVRVGNTPIDASNFDSMEDVPFSDTCPGGGTACVDVRDRFVQRDYYFAVASADAAGNQGPVVSAGPLSASLNTTILTGQEAPGSNERFGISSDGSASINGDGYADLVAGSARGNKVYIWFGSDSGYGGAPNVTISGPTGVEFGRAVSVVGDIDSDGFNDIAIGAPGSDGLRGRVYVIRGRASWPSTINAQTQADTEVVMSGSEPLFTYAYAGSALARLGDFNDDGYDDFAIGATSYDDTLFVGYVAIVLGTADTASGWELPSTITLPDDVGTDALAVAGDPSVAYGALGWGVLGLGSFFGASAGDTLVAAATFGDVVYAFRGQSGGPSGQIAIGTADSTLTGSGSTRLGNSLALVGSFAGRPAVAVGNPRLNASGASGRVFVHFGSNAGPFSGPVTEIRSSTFTVNTSRFGYAVMGSGVSGTSLGMNLLGNASGDIAATGQLLSGAPAPVYLMSGETVRAASGGTMDAATDAEVIFDLASVSGLDDWRGASYLSSMIQDCNGDGFADLAIGEFDGSSGAPAYDGRLVVIW